MQLVHLVQRAHSASTRCVLTDELHAPVAEKAAAWPRYRVHSSARLHEWPPVPLTNQTLLTGYDLCKS